MGTPRLLIVSFLTAFAFGTAEVVIIGMLASSPLPAGFGMVFCNLGVLGTLV